LPPGAWKGCSKCRLGRYPALTGSIVTVKFTPNSNYIDFIYIPFSIILLTMLNKVCPRCSGKMYVELGNASEATCLNCGYTDYGDFIPIVEEELIKSRTRSKRLAAVAGKLVKRREFS
jgi:hypothetical protein